MRRAVIKTYRFISCVCLLLILCCVINAFIGILFCRNACIVLNLLHSKSRKQNKQSGKSIHVNTLLTFRQLTQYSILKQEEN